MNETQRENGRHVDRQRDEEHEEVSVVSATNAVVDPRTVMVEHLDAVIANGAMRTPRRSVELAGNAPLHANSDAVDVNVPVQGSAEIVFSILVGTR